MNIFDLTGPEFLKFYFGALAILMALCFILPHLLRFPFDLPTQAGRELSPFDVAALKNGKRGVIRAAIATLWHRGLLATNGSARRVARTARAVPHDLHPVEKNLLEDMGRVAEPRRLERTRLPEVDRIEDHLAHQGLILPPFRRELLRLMRTLPPLILFITGLIKIGVGIARDRPVGYLFLGSLLTAAMTLFWFLHMPRRTWRGDRLLIALAREHAALEFASRRVREQARPADAAMSAALFGIPALVFSDDLAHVLNPPPAASTAGVSGSGGASRCGGSSCSGGGGGGGCGGCGGGGGS